MPSRPISAASQSSCQQTPATVQRPISKRSRAVESMAMWQPVGRGTRLPVVSRMRVPSRPERRRSRRDGKRSPRQPPSCLGSKPCGRRSRQAATQVPIDCVSNCPSQCSDRLNKHADSASFCSAASRRCGPNGQLSAPLTTFSSLFNGGVCLQRCWQRGSKQRGETKTSRLYHNTVNAVLNIATRDYLDRLLAPLPAPHWRGRRVTAAHNESAVMCHGYVLICCSRPSLRYTASPRSSTFARDCPGGLGLASR